MYFILYRCANWLARVMAYLGGAALLGVIILTCVSIIGRALFTIGFGPGPIRGIYDITEIIMAAAIFAFLPWCQIRRSHAVVDLFKPAFPHKMNQILDLLIDVAMALAASIVAWRLYLGMLDKSYYGETTLIAQIPVWQGYLASLVGAVAFALVAGFCILRSARALMGWETERPTNV